MQQMSGLMMLGMGLQAALVIVLVLLGISALAVRCLRTPPR